MAPRLKAGEPIKGVAKGIVRVEDAGVTITLPSGHQETVTTEEAENLYSSLDDLLNG